MTTAVTFKKSYPPYSIGDVAGFDDEFAERLIDKGLADHHSDNEQIAQVRADQAYRNRRASAREVVVSEDLMRQDADRLNRDDEPADTTPGGGAPPASSSTSTTPGAEAQGRVTIRRG